MDYENNLKKIDAYKKKFARYNRIRKSYFRKYFKIYHRYEVIGVDNIPDGPALIAVNHGGGFDLDIVSLSDCTHPTRDIQPLVAADWHFLFSPWGRYYIGTGIPLWTQGGIRWEYIDRHLDKNGDHYPGLVSIYPEGHSGTFKERNVLHKFFPGVVRIALRYRVPIVPVAMIGFHRASPIPFEIQRDHGPNDPICLPFTLPVKLKAEIGEPFELSEYYGKELNRAREFRVANEIVRPKVAELLAKHGKVALEQVNVEMQKP